ncbi:MAG: hypothetical protein ABR503_01810, partial [Chitinophagaceae bacterium]
MVYFLFGSCYLVLVVGSCCLVVCYLFTGSCFLVRLPLLMAILLCAATEKELAPTIEFLKNSGTGYEVDILITGVGLTSCTYHLTKQINIRPPSFIIQAGVAGSLEESLDLGKVVIVAKDVIGDEGVVEKNEFKSLFQLGLKEENKFPWQEGRLINN